MGPSYRSIIKKTGHAVEAPWLTPSEEIQEGTVPSAGKMRVFFIVR
jgi:hypothetical protein